jgi:hypothetical protein
MEQQELQSSIGKPFTLSHSGGEIELELVRIRELPARDVPGLRPKPFALLFRGPSVRHHTEALPRQVHELRASDGKVFSIYLEPVISTGEPGLLYEAIFD